MISIYEAYVGLGHLFAYDHACLNRADVYVFRLLWVTEIFSDRDETCPNAYHHDACKVCVYMFCGELSLLVRMQNIDIWTS